MLKFLPLAILLFLLSCKEKKANLNDKVPIESVTFFKAFTTLKLPVTVADTGLQKIGDTTHISYEVFNQFVADSALSKYKDVKSGKTFIRPAGKIESNEEYYLLAVFESDKKTSLVVFLFDKEKKYMGSLLLVSSPAKDGFLHSVNINTEPTFLISRDKTANDKYVYTKTGFAWSPEAKQFIEVINDSNEGKKNDVAIIDPIDTLSKKNQYSGNYVKDKKNFISLRDGRNASNYLFFLHFEKNESECVGELKGTLTLVDESKAVFQLSGDPCVIDFTFARNSIKVKERGSCGNHRGMNCLFDDNYKRKISNK